MVTLMIENIILAFLVAYIKNKIGIVSSHTWTKIKKSKSASEPSADICKSFETKSLALGL